MDSITLNTKLKDVFCKLSAPGYNPSGNFCFESLLTHLSTDKIAGSIDTLIMLPSVAEWIIYYSSEWNGSLKDANQFIKSFILRLTAKATENKSLFPKFLMNNVYKNIFESFDLKTEKNPSFKLALLEIMTAMTLHDLGVQWLYESGKWMDCVELCQQNQTIYFSRAGCKFFSALIWKLSDQSNEQACENILKVITTPILDNRWKSSTLIDDEDNSLMHHALFPSLNILNEVMYNVEHFGRSNIIIEILSTKFNLDWHLCNLIQLCRSTELLENISKLLYLHMLSKIFVTDRIMEITTKELLEFGLIHCNSMTTLISKRNPENVLEISSFAFIFMAKVRIHHNLVYELDKDGKALELTNQIIVMCLMPMLCSLRLCQTEFVNNYVDKLVSIVCEHTTRLLYSFRDLIREKNDLSVITKAIQHAVIFRKYLNQSQAVLIFQSFFYALQDYVPSYDEKNVISNYVVVGVNNKETVNLVHTLLDAIYIYIEDFGIAWQESVEVLCVHNFCTRIIKTSNMDPKLSILAFKLAQLTIKKFLSPNLALLMNTAQGSIIEEIGKNIFTKLHDLNWGIRDSAMELLYVVVDVGESKFPPFQQQITENELPELVITLAVEDSEPYVRATALKCISSMVRIKVVWDNHLKYLDLPAKMMKILYEESEGLVRKEAAKVVTNMYQGKKFAASTLDDIFITMFHSAVKDLHWEVQLTALDFWKKVIISQMCHQGMIDGVFPSVTFSKENRKIVQLNDREIKTRLMKILNELALRGGLGALLGCMNDESDIEVMEKSFEIISDFMKLLEKYNCIDVTSILDTSAVIKRPVMDENFFKTDKGITQISHFRNKADVRNDVAATEICISFHNDANSDTVIESIVCSDDVNLLANVYNNQMKVNQQEKNNKYDFAKTNGVKDISNMFVEPEVFLKTVRANNYGKIIADKKAWRTGISTDINSLIEDILAVYEPTDINSMDCY